MKVSSSIMMQTCAFVASILWTLSCLIVDLGQVNAASLQNSSSKITKNKENDETCKSESCKIFAKSFVSKLNYEFNPCDDFYEFICSKQDMTVRNISRNIIDRNLHVLIKSLNHSNINDSGNLRRLRNLHKSCMKPNPNNLESLKGLINELGGFPLGGRNSGWNDQVPFDWLKTVIKFRRLGIDHNLFVSVLVESGQGADVYRLTTHPKIGVPPKRERVALDKSIQIDLIRGLYDDVESNLEQQIEELASFRKELFEIQDKKSPYGDQSNTKLRSLTMEVPGIKWKKFVEDLTDVNFDDEDVVSTTDLDLIEWIVSLVFDTHPNVLANHMMMTIIETFAPYLKMPNRLAMIQEADCVFLLEKKLGLAMTVEYYRKHIDRTTISLTQEIVKSVQTEIKLMIDEAQWIADDKTRTAAKAKIDAMKFEIGLAEKLVDPKTIEWFYSGLTLDSDKLIYNLMSITKLHNDRLFGDFLNQPVENLSWFDYALMRDVIAPNAEYLNPFNKIRIFPGHISQIYLDANRLASLNFGMVGSTIGHETMHAFDIDCVIRDKNRQVTRWFDYTSRIKYLEKAGCLRYQYDGIKVNTTDNDEWETDGKLTLSENIADNAGFKAAYRAFERWVQLNPDEAKYLDGIELDAKKLFWVSFGQNWCSQSKHRKKNTHSPNKLRVNIPLSNYKEFSRDFQCPTGSAMNPEHKCVIW